MQQWKVNIQAGIFTQPAQWILTTFGFFYVEKAPSHHEIARFRITGKVANPFVKESERFNRTGTQLHGELTTE